MIFDSIHLVLIILGSFLIGTIGLLEARGNSQRFFLLALLVGMFFYNGIGAADIRVAPSFTVYYFVLFAAVIIGFHLGRSVFLSASKVVGRRLSQTLADIDRNPKWQWVIAIYVLLSAFPLVWPEFRLKNLFHPPLPDLYAIIYMPFNEETDTLSHVVRYAHLTLTPFFYVALYRLRCRLRWIFALFVLLLYMDYVAKAYIGRGIVMVHLTLLVLAAWFLRPQNRRRIMIGVAAAIPMLLYGAYYYAVVRIGGSVYDVDIAKGIGILLDSEVGFPKNVGMPIIKAGARVNLAAYFVWLFTLPLPKLLTGPIEGARINYEISEIVNGIPIGAPGWYVVLPGLVSESVYIFGSYFFWLHGIFIGVLGAFMVRLMERTPQLLFLYLYIVLIFAFMLNRGGIASFLPRVINEFSLFYLFLFFVVLIKYRKPYFINSCSY